MPNGPYSSEVKGKLVTGNSSLIQICSLFNRSLYLSLTVQVLLDYTFGEPIRSVIDLRMNKKLI